MLLRTALPSTETSDRPAKSERNFHLILVLLAAAGIALSIRVFLLPYNTIADEEEYLSEIFSAASGQPQGWAIRHLAYPIMLSPFVAAAHAIGVDVPSLALVARVTNWLMWWIGLYASFQVARHLFDTETAWLAVILIAFNWVWMLSAKRLMMDVPSSVWLLLAIYCYAAAGEFGLKRLLLGLFCAAMATVTKFQMGPLAAIYGCFVLLDRLFTGKVAHTAIGVAFSFSLVAGIGLVDRVTYGKWFSSLLEFHQYNFVNAAAFAEKYGTCESALYYVQNAKDVFSHLVWPLALLGLAGLVSFGHSARRVLLALIVASYLIIVHLICHKQSRYLIAILPQICILAAAAYTYLYRRAVSLLGARFSPVLPFAAATGVGVILLTLVPRNEVKPLFSEKETCADFVYASIAMIPKGSTIMLAVPCGMPGYYLREFRVAYGDLGFNDYTRSAELAKFRSRILETHAAFAEHESLLDKELRASWSPGSYFVYVSPQGRYRLYLRKQSGKDGAVGSALMM